MTTHGPALLDALRPRPTGATIVTFRDGVEPARQRAALLRAAGGRVADLGGSDLPAVAAAQENGRALLLPEAGIALVPGRPEAEAARSRLLDDDAVAEVRPEFWLFPLDAFGDTAALTWGLQATGADLSPFSGRGVRLCVLDTGLDAGHPDFVGRAVVAQSFVEGVPTDDVQGHGTHCAGTAAGHRDPPGGAPRYGVAPDADLVIGKVLDDTGSGREGDILAGMLWAVEQGSAVVSMSLGRATQPGERPSLAYERLGRLALLRGSLIVAAAGNDSARGFGFVAPVGAPANSPSILAVAALDQGLDVAEFSSGGINLEGGEVDLAAPGVGVLSSVPRPRDYALLRGTSMACPHVAGLAALWAESDPDLRGRALWDRLVATARALPLPPRDVGADLAQAPRAAPRRPVPAHGPPEGAATG